MPKPSLSDARVYLCVDARERQGDLPEFLDAVLSNGVDIVQLRQKGQNSIEAKPELEALKTFAAACERHGKLLAVNDRAVASTADATKYQFRTGAWSKATYSLVRNAVPLQVPVILVPSDKSLFVGLRFIALIYLGIGLYVLLRRWTAPKSTHFYLFCLVSYIFYAFHFTGKLNQFDWIVYWSIVVAELLQPVADATFSSTGRSSLLFMSALTRS